MSNSNNRHVVPNPAGGWDVRAPGSSRSSGHFDTQGAAQERATDIVGNLSGGGEVVIHRPNGQIRDSNTIGRTDPFPPRG